MWDLLASLSTCPMLATTGFQEENDCGINYLWRRLSQRRPPLEWTGWMVISQTVQAYVYCIHLLETLPSVFENSARGMLVQDLMPFTLSFWPFFFGHCLLSLLLLSCQVSIMPRSNFNSSWNPKTIESVLKYTLSVSVFSYLMHQVLFGDCLLMLRLKWK